MYWTSGSYIIKAYLNGTEKEIVLKDKLSATSTIVVHYASQLLFYATESAIKVMSLNRRYNFPIIQSHGIRDIALHPANGMMFWSSNRGIEVAAVDGTRHRLLLRFTTDPLLDLTLDSEGKRLYWRIREAAPHTIESMAIDGTDRKRVRTVSQYYNGGLAILGETMFISKGVTYTECSVGKVDLSSPYSSQSIGPRFRRHFRTIAAYSSAYNARGFQSRSSCNNLTVPCDYVCIPTPSIHRCACWDGFNFINGTKCSIPLSCFIDHDCNDRGTCSNRVCECNDDYTGPKCETKIDIDECLSNPCLNGGNCSTPQVEMFSCDCLAGYTGDTCESDIDECASSPCRNGASCYTSQVDMFSCDCLAGYTGDNCEIAPNTCHSDPCLNGGSCRNRLNAYHCQCVNGFSGDVCEKQSKEGSCVFIIAGAAGGGVTIGLVIVPCVLVHMARLFSTYRSGSPAVSSGEDPAITECQQFCLLLTSRLGLSFV
ncbi:hypothetical protein LSAT2_026730 [Lamellibrachia satsuma]|nr:hypothetical protein LSAT2_026730 [Lamellibrachia satsuma]